MAVKRHTLTWFTRLGGRMRFLRRSPSAGEVLVLDDGFLHRSVALHASPEEAVDPAAVAAYVDLLEAPALVVHVVVPAEVCAERVRERGLWRHRTGWSDDDLERYVKNADVVVDAAVSRARANGWRIVEVDNTAVDVRGLEASLTAVADAVASRRRDVIRAVPRASRAVEGVRARMGAPSIGEDTVRQVLERCGLRPAGRVRDLGGRRSRNVVVATGGGPKVIKRYRDGWAAEAVDHGHAVLERLAEVGFAAPRLVRTSEGVTRIEVGEETFAVFDEVPGRSYASTYLRRVDRLRLMALAGATLAGWHEALDGFTPGWAAPPGVRGLRGTARARAGLVPDHGGGPAPRPRRLGAAASARGRRCWSGSRRSTPRSCGPTCRGG